jgi:hypothetical protein
LNTFLKVPISSSLLLVLNEDGMAVNYKIVPNDQRTFVQQLLSEIWETEEMQEVTSVVYTDNPKADSNLIKQTFLQCFPDLLLGVEVLLDIFHAKARVLKEMSRTHPDYRASKSDLTTIFALLQVRGHYDTTGDLQKSLDDWVEKYSIIYAYTTLSMAEKIDYLSEISQR